jgi:hypothetical protein
MNRDVCEHGNPEPCGKCMPEALRLADALGRYYTHLTVVPDINREAAAELRRLHAVNADLLQALKDATDAIEHWGTYATDYFQKKWDLQSDITAARAAIARAEGQV